LIEKQLVKLNLGIEANPQLTKEKIEELQMLLEFKDVFAWT
jgi:hypothetical protein